MTSIAYYTLNGARNNALVLGGFSGMATLLIMGGVLVLSGQGGRHPKAIVAWAVTIVFLFGVILGAVGSVN